MKVLLAVFFSCALVTGFGQTGSDQQLMEKEIRVLEQAQVDLLLKGQAAEMKKTRRQTLP